MYVPACMMKLPVDKRNVEYYTYYHIYTANFFCDTIIANGIPCETHSKYIKETVQNIDTTGKLMSDILTSCKAMPNGMRQRMTKKEFGKITKKYQKKQSKK